ncbi:MAG: hypothetical protein M1834_005364 [Cirrosporium novae-zelandiae]|nr:MAG: hypothetical protein M1834_005364 [Cirrosporium novae-zelandiae]
MPAPIAKGIIITAGIIIAAGIAVYESPEVQAWIVQQRRKLAAALRSLGDNVDPQNRNRQGAFVQGQFNNNAARSSPDASMNADDSPEAAERRRIKRLEILERGRILEEKRRERRKAMYTEADGKPTNEGSSIFLEKEKDQNGVMSQSETNATVFNEKAVFASAIAVSTTASEDVLRNRNAPVQPAPTQPSSTTDKSDELFTLTPTTTATSTGETLASPPPLDLNAPYSPSISSQTFHSTASLLASQNENQNQDPPQYTPTTLEDQVSPPSYILAQSQIEHPYPHDPPSPAPPSQSSFTFSEMYTPSEPRSLATGTSDMDFDGRSISIVSEGEVDGLRTPTEAGWSEVGSAVSGSERDFR